MAVVYRINEGKARLLSEKEYEEWLNKRVNERLSSFDIFIGVIAIGILTFFF